MVSTSQKAGEGQVAQIEWVFLRIARAHGASLDILRLKSALAKSFVGLADIYAIREVCRSIGWVEPVALTKPDRSRLPIVANTMQNGWVAVVDYEPDGSWRCVQQQGEIVLDQKHFHSPLLLLQPQGGSGENEAKTKDSNKVTFTKIKNQTLRAYRANMMEAVVATVFMAALLLMTSLFSMQVYDRVIPTRGEHTLLVLGIGVCLCIVLELILKFVRAHIMDRVAVGIDHRLSRELFQRLLLLRVDQIPASVGSLAGQMRGYEQVRNYYTASTLFSLVDVPVAIIFLWVIAVISHPYVALVPLVAAVVSLAMGLLARRHVNRLAGASAQYSHKKTGLLVEAVEGVETIKSGSGGWKFLSRWLKLNQYSIGNELSLRRSSEAVGFCAASLQQLSYAGVVAVGALEVMKGNMTMGSLIAASILGQRVLTPILTMPNLFVQHAHARAAIVGLDQLYDLKTDNDGLDRVLLPETLRANICIENVQFSYGVQQNIAFKVEKLNIQPGGRIGIIGPIGSGKSTLLRLLSGMYVPNTGRVLFDGLDLSHISRDVINRQIGYLQQEHRLFQGTLRENLLIGLPDPGDEQLLQVMRRTGMDQLVLGHPLGLERPIAEGGKGLSGGQRQLLAFTRLLLTNTSLLLLDEPTANMDERQEQQCLQVLQQEAMAGKTMLIVTHKPSLLPLVDRILVVVGSQIVIDGPRQQVLKHFANNKLQEQATAAPTDENSGVGKGTPVIAPRPSSTTGVLSTQEVAS